MGIFLVTSKAPETPKIPHRALLVKLIPVGDGVVWQPRDFVNGDHCDDMAITG